MTAVHPNARVALRGEGDAEEPAAASGPIVPAATSNEPLRFFPYTDFGNAERLAQRYRGHLIYVAGRGWYVWDGRVWAADALAIATHLAGVTARELHREALDQPSGDGRDKALTWARKSEMGPRLEAAAKHARPLLGVKAETLDADPDVLNTPAGIVSLRSGELRPHDPLALCTKITHADYDPDAQAPVWERVIADVTQRDEKLASYLQAAIGYGATGRMSEQCIFIAEGGGSNGKGTIFGAVHDALGGYARAADFSTFVESRPSGAGAPRSDLVQLVGSRFVTASEGGAGRRLNEAFVKSITGCDVVSVRELHERQFEFLPSFKIFLSTNYKPRIRGDDHGIWRRMRVLPFHAKFEGETQDKSIPDKLKLERAGILAWVVRGARRWYAERLPVAAAVLDATTNYREEEDVLSRFIDEECVLASGCEVKSGVLYEAFRAWALKTGEDSVRDRDLKARLENKGFEFKRTNSFRGWKSVRLFDSAIDGPRAG